MRDDKAKSEKKTLEEWMQLAKEDEVVFIGAANGYLFIGNLEAYRADFGKISEKATKMLADRTNLLNQSIAHVNELVSICNDKQDGHEYPQIIKELQDIRKTLYQREVLKSYRKVSDDKGTAVIIRGLESGKYWFSSEYEKKKKEETHDTTQTGCTEQAAGGDQDDQSRGRRDGAPV